MPFRVICDNCGETQTNQEFYESGGIQISQSWDAGEERLTLCGWLCTAEYAIAAGQLSLDEGEEAPVEELDELDYEPEVVEDDPQLVMPPPRSTRLMPVSPQLDPTKSDYGNVVIQNMRVDGRTVS